MILTVFRPKRIKNGKIRIGRSYRGIYRLDGEDRITDIPLHTTDRRVAQQQQRIEQIVKEKQMEAVGLPAGRGWTAQGDLSDSGAYRPSPQDTGLLPVSDAVAKLPSFPERLGIEPASVTYVLQSHLHLEHTGAISSANSRFGAISRPTQKEAAALFSLAARQNRPPPCAYF